MSKTQPTRRCLASTKAGSACRMPPLIGSDLCFNHDPSIAERRGLARRKGGSLGRRARPSDLAGVFAFESPENALELLCVAANETLALDNTAARNRTLAQIAVASMKVWEAIIVDQRVAALELMETFSLGVRGAR